MHKFERQLLLLLTEGIEEDLEVVEQMGFALVDKQTVGEFEITLFKTVNGHYLGDNMYQIGLNIKGRGFLSDQQNKVEVNKNFIKDFRLIGDVIKHWLETESKMIKIGSMVKQKTIVYKKMIDRYTTIKTGSVQDEGMFNNFNVML